MAEKLNKRGQAFVDAYNQKQGVSPSDSGGNNSPWTYTPSPEVDKAINGITSGSYKSGLYSNVNDYSKSLGSSFLSVADMQNAMNQANDSYIKSANQNSLNGKQATDEELANIYLYNMTKNMSEDDKNEVYQRLQDTLNPIDQGKNPVYIRDRVEDYINGGVIGEDVDHNLVRSNDGYLSRYEANNTQTSNAEYTNEDAAKDVEENISTAEAKAEQQAIANVRKEGKYLPGTRMYDQAVADAKADILSADTEYLDNVKLREEILSDIGKENRNQERQDRADYTRIGAAANTDLSAQANEMLNSNPDAFYQVVNNYVKDKYANNPAFTQEDVNREIMSLQMNGFSDMDFLSYFDRVTNAK